MHIYKYRLPKWHVGKEFTHQCRRSGLIAGSGRALGVGNGNPCQYSCLENSMDRAAWWATVYGVAKNWTRLSIYFPYHIYL